MTNEPSFVSSLPYEQRRRRFVALQSMASARKSLQGIGIRDDVRGLRLGFQSTKLVATFADEPGMQRTKLDAVSRTVMTWPEMCRARYQLHLSGFACELTDANRGCWSRLQPGDL